MDKRTVLPVPGVVVYGTKYGSTREYAEAVAEGLRVPALNCGFLDEDMVRRIAVAQVVVVGSPIYGPSVLPAMKAFLGSARVLLKTRVLSAFVVAGDTVWDPGVGEGGTRNLEKLTGLLPADPVVTAIFGGRLRMGDLDDGDRRRIQVFYEGLGREATGFDRMNLEAVAPFWRPSSGKREGNRRELKGVRRMTDEQLIHDWVVKTLKSRLGRDYREIRTNLANREHEFEGFYPDLILGNHGMTLAVVEVETERSIVPEKAEEWKALVAGGTRLILMVPKRATKDVTLLLWDHGIADRVSLGTYEIAIQMP